MTRRGRTGHHRRISYGASSGVTLDDPEGTMAMFQNDIDTMAAAGQTWTRYGVNFADVVSSGTATSITWYQPGLDMYDAALDYARSKGIKTCLVLPGAPDYASSYTFSQYRTIAGVFWGFLINRWAHKVELWHLFNESSGSHYQTYAALPFSTVSSNNYPSGYLTELATLLADGRALIRAANPGGLLSTSVEGYPMDNDRQAEWEYYLDVVAPSLDAISLHIYPDDYAPEIALMGTRITAMRARYNKPVYVTEFGLPTQSWTQAQQGTYVVQMIESMKAGLPRAMILYMHRDIASTYVNSIDSFGIRLNNGTNKSGYAAITAALSGAPSGSSSGSSTGNGAGTYAYVGAASGTSVGGGTATFRAASSAAAFPSTSFTVNVPAGTATNDKLVAIQVGDDGATLASMTATGWTLAGSYSVAGWGFLKVWTRTVSGAPPANYTFGGNAGGGQQVAILGFITASATLAVSPVFNDVATASASHVLPAAAAASGNIQMSAVYTDWKGVGAAVSWVVAASGMNERIDTNDAYSSLWVGTQPGTTSGTKTITASRSVDYVSLSLAIAAA